MGVYEWALGTAAPEAGGRQPARLNIIEPVDLVANAVAVQLFGPRLGRKALIIANTGSGTAVIRTGQNTGTPGFTIASGGVLGLEVEAELWATSVAGTSLEGLETYFELIGPGVNGDDQPTGDGTDGRALDISEVYHG